MTMRLAAARRYWFLYVLVAPPIVYFIVFRYIPIAMQVILSFKEYSLLGGVLGSPWVGFDNFVKIFGLPEFYGILQNTIVISLLRLLFGFIPPIFLAILLFDLRLGWLRKLSQSMVYLPHFFSWVIIYGVVYGLVSNTGVVNRAIAGFGGEPVNFLMSVEWFLPLIVGTGIWKEIGWGTIIYLAGLTAIDPTLYEAAKIDGAKPLQRIRYVTLPALRPLIIFLFTLNLGGILYAGVDQIILFYNPATYSIGDIIDTWVYRQGIQGLQFSITATVSLFQSLIGLVLVLSANKLSRKFAGIGLW